MKVKQNYTKNKKTKRGRIPKNLFLFTCCFLVSFIHLSSSLCRSIHNNSQVPSMKLNEEPDLQQLIQFNHSEPHILSHSVFVPASIHSISHKLRLGPVQSPTSHQARQHLVNYSPPNDNQLYNCTATITSTLLDAHSLFLRSNLKLLLSMYHSRN